MKIGVIFTGGTIGSVLDESGYIGPKDGTTFRVLKQYEDEYNEDVQFDAIEPYRICFRKHRQELCLWTMDFSIARWSLASILSCVTMRVRCGETMSFLWAICESRRSGLRERM